MIFGLRWVQFVYWPKKRFFGKIDCYYCLQTVFFYVTTSRKILKEQILRLKVAYFWAKLGASYFPKRNLFVKGNQHCFGLTIVYHDAMSFKKNYHRTDNENKVA